MTTPCVGLGKLFDSTEWYDHERAKALCDECKALEWCKGELEKAKSRPGLPPTGTWAGQLILDRRAPTRREACGTTSGATAHRRANEEVCDDCADARDAYDRRRNEQKRASKARAAQRKPTLMEWWELQ